MPGQKIIRSQVALLDALGQERHEQLVTDFASGAKVKDMARDLKVSIRVFYAFLRSRPDIYAAWREAKKYRAEGFAESALDIADAVAESPDAISKAHLQVKVRQWLASVNDREMYGKDAKPQGESHLHLHLTAMEEINAAETKTRMDALETAHRVEHPILDGEFEVLADERPSAPAIPSIEDLL
jgi:hypothetical protein